ncbi:MAG TPA: BON domain-containing protein [Azospirillum sp.]|nr:BON domain-containing protein [Azospirillum sp.]
MIGLIAVAVAGTGCVPLVVGAAATPVVVAAHEKRGVRGFASDTAIRAQINNLWLQHSIDLFQNVRLRVDQGRVLLTGRTADPQTRLDAVRLAWQADGVREVINEIQVDNESGIIDSAKDTWINTQLRTRITFDGAVSSQNYSIDTVNGVVYLMGWAKSQDELDRVIGHARAIPNVQRIVNYVQL